MRRYVLIGHPVGHSISPALHRAAYDALGLADHAYDVVDCPDEASVRAVLADLRGGGLSGANVTVPHKRLALSLADEVDESARAVGAANVLALDGGRIVAHNTDVAALAEELDALSPKRRTACVIGTGGAALAAVVACRRIGVERVYVTGRAFREDAGPGDWAGANDFRRAQALPVPWSLAEGGQWHEAIRAADIVVQSTSAGMLGAAPGDGVAAMACFDALPSGAVAYDVVYNPPVTPFIQGAEAAGVPVRGGLGMLVGQAVRALEIWTGATGSREAMGRAARHALFGEVDS
jgi:shikimate dehydrogenase